jgi:hypothetical protein
MALTQALANEQSMLVEVTFLTTSLTRLSLE